MPRCDSSGTTVIVAAAPPPRWCSASAREVEVDELVAVQRVDVALVAPRRRGEAQPAAAAERLRLLDGHDLGAEARELLARTAAPWPAAQLTITRSTPARTSSATW